MLRHLFHQNKCYFFATVSFSSIFHFLPSFHIECIFRFSLCCMLNFLSFYTHVYINLLLHSFFVSFSSLFFGFFFPDYWSPHIFTLFRSYNTSQCLSIINFGDKKRYMETSWTRIYWWVDELYTHIHARIIRFEIEKKE